MLQTDKYGDTFLEASPADLFTSPRLPHVESLPAHLTTAIAIGTEDAEVVCHPDCPACATIFSLERFWDDIGNAS